MALQIKQHEASKAAALAELDQAQKSLEAMKAKLLENTVSNVQSEESSAVTEAVNTFISARAQLDPLKTLSNHAEKARKYLQSIADEDKESETVVFVGDLGSVEFGSSGEADRISDMHGLIGALKAKVGYEGLLQILKINLGDVKKILSPAEYAPFITSEKTSRQVENYTKV